MARSWLSNTYIRTPPRTYTFTNTELVHSLSLFFNRVLPPVLGDVRQAGVREYPSRPASSAAFFLMPSRSSGNLALRTTATIDFFNSSSPTRTASSSSSTSTTTRGTEEQLNGQQQQLQHVNRHPHHHHLLLQHLQGAQQGGAALPRGAQGAVRYARFVAIRRASSEPVHEYMYVSLHACCV